MSKKRKNSNFQTAKKIGSLSRHGFYGEWDRKIFEYRRIGPDLPVTFFLIATSLTKNFCVYRRATYLREKKIVPVEKNFSPLLPT